MCDTVVIVNDEGVWFGKNSDREPGEAQVVVRLPAVRGDRSRAVKLTHIPIRQVPDRHAVILSKPHWMWGAEMGINEHGVVIGNEAIFSRVRSAKPGMLGMDLVRLGLERADSAAEALKVMTRLIEQVGQGGPAGYRDGKFHYDNSFIIADKHEAWVLETVQKQWVAKKVQHSAAISNCLTIGNNYDLNSAELETFAYMKKRAVKVNNRLDFAATFDTRTMPKLARAHERLACSVKWLDEKLGKPMSLQDLANHLRTHTHDQTSKKDGKTRGPLDGSNADICMHATGPVRRSQTCGSMIAHLSEDGVKSLFTGTSAPCLSIFRPVDFDFEQNYTVLSEPDLGLEKTLWARSEPIHHRALFDTDFRHQLQRSRNEVEVRLFEALCAEEPDPVAADQMAQQWLDGQLWVIRRKPRRLPYSRLGLYWRKQATNGVNPKQVCIIHRRAPAKEPSKPQARTLEQAGPAQAVME